MNAKSQLAKVKKLPTRASPRIASRHNGINNVEINQTSIRVIVRVRPPNQRETQENYRTVVKVCDSQMLVFDPKEEEDPFFYRGVVQKGRDILKKQNKNLEFLFNRVFDGESTNSDVFEGSTRDLISSLLEGYNCSVFAYGATGAGKTHTMLGKENDPGITYRTVAELFSQIEQMKEEKDFNLGVTYLEIYNENVQDLLEKKGPLFLREDGQRGVVITGLKVITINNADELLSLLTRGNKNRTQFPTDANGESSRSHAVFQVYISMKSKLSGQVKRMKLSMIDLAGSERASVTGCKGDRLKEGANINRSLLALGNCINNLADGIKHIPYRDSKLTRLLKDSLGGNCQTVMIANVSPSSLCYEDTYNTLRYANRAKKIKTTAKKNIVNCNLTTSDYVRLLEECRRENVNLKRKLQEYENGGAPKAASASVSAAANAAVATLNKETLMKSQAATFLKKLQDLWDKKKALNEKVLSLESADKILCCRIYAKNSADERLCHLTSVLEPVSSDEHNSSGKKRVKKSMMHFEGQRERICTEIKAVWSELQKVEQEMQNVIKNIREKNVENLLRTDIELFNAKLEAVRSQLQYDHAKKICSLLQCEHSSNDNIIKTMSSLLLNYHNLLNSNGSLTTEMKDEFRQTIKKLEGVRGIKWSDEASIRKEEDFYSMIVLDIHKLNNSLTSSPPIFNCDISEKEDDSVDAEMASSDSLNDTYSIDQSRNVKKRALVDKNSFDKDVSAAKQPKMAAPPVAVKNLLSGKENSKTVTKKMSVKHLQILEKIKADRMKKLQSNNDTMSKLSGRTAAKAIQLSHKFAK